MTDLTPLVTAEQLPAEASAARARLAWRQIWLKICSITPRALARTLITLTLASVVLWLIIISGPVLLPFQIGVVLAYLLIPVISFLTRYVPRWLAILAVYAVAAGLASQAVAFIVPPLIQQVETLINYATNPDTLTNLNLQLREAIVVLPEQLQPLVLQAVDRGAVTFRENFGSYAQQLIEMLAGGALSVVGAFSFIIGLFVVPVWLFFVLRDVEPGRTAFEGALPPGIRADVIAMLRIIDRVFKSFVRGQLLLGLIVGTMSYVGLTALQMAGVEGIRFTVLLAVFAGVTEFIPYLGPLLGAAPALIVGFSHSVQTGLFVLLLYFIIQQLENAFLVPYIVGQALNIHPGILIVLMIMLSQFGIFWIILAAPLAAITRDLYVYAMGRLSELPRPVGLLPGRPVNSGPPPQQDEQRTTTADEQREQQVVAEKQQHQRDHRTQK